MIDLYPLETKAFIRQVPTFEWDRLVRQPARGLEKSGNSSRYRSRLGAPACGIATDVARGHFAQQSTNSVRCDGSRPDISCRPGRRWRGRPW
jgi:hypothetical protein